MTISRKSVLFFALFAAVLAVALAPRGPAAGEDGPVPAKKKAARKAERPKDDDPPMIDPLGPNAACYVCHTTFVREELVTQHLPDKVDCVKCHGTSEKHANDENIGATKPDILYKKGEVDAMCKKCHDTHDAPAQKVVARFVERKLQGDAFICTDCHGTHKIDRAAQQAAASAAGK